MERDLALMTLEDLTQIARQRGLRGYSTMTKTELVDALSALEAKRPQEAPEDKTLRAPTGPVADSLPAPQLETVVDAATDAETDAQAESTFLKPTTPQFKKTWIRHDLLIDEELPELPESYGDEKLVLLVRDPYWIHAYWTVSAKTMDRMRALGGIRMALRVYDVTDIVFNGLNAHTWFEIPAPEYVRNWNIQVPQDGRNYLVELGWVTTDGRFLPAMRSNVADVPIARPSPIVADTFVALPFNEDAKPAEPEALETTDAIIETEAPEAPFLAPIEDQPAPPAPAEPVQEGSLPDTMFKLSTRGRGYWSADTPRYGDLTTVDYMDAETGSHRLSSHGLSSFAAPPTPPGAPEAPKVEKDFWLVANCELIVYGATEPDAKVTLRGQKIELRPDGTFSIRFAFPDGLHPIPIRAVNADGDMERSITITVSRDTQA